MARKKYALILTLIGLCSVCLAQELLTIQGTINTTIDNYQKGTVVTIFGLDGYHYIIGKDDYQYAIELDNINLDKVHINYVSISKKTLQQSPYKEFPDFNIFLEYQYKRIKKRRDQITKVNKKRLDSITWLEKRHKDSIEWAIELKRKSAIRDSIHKARMAQIDIEIAASISKRNAEKAAAHEKWQNKMTNMFGLSAGVKIANGKVWIGMTTEMARYSWGEPKDINRTTTANYVNEQWVYGSGNYLYFKNGILTTIQN